MCNCCDCRLEFSFLDNEFLVKLPASDCAVSLLSIWSTIVLYSSGRPPSTFFNLIFKIHWFSWDCKLVKLCGKALEVLVDWLVSFTPVVYLLSHLLDMAFCMFGVGRWEGCPDLSWCRRCREDGLDRGGHGAKKSIVNQFVLAFPQVERRIRKHTCVSGDGWRRNNCRSINVADEIITIKQSMNLIDGSTWWN